MTSRKRALLLMPHRVFCAKSAEVVERNGDDVFSLAEERAKRAKESGIWEVCRGWVLKITT